MAGFARRHEWLIKLQQRIQQAIPIRFQRSITTRRLASGLEHLRGQPMEQIHAAAAPDVLAKLRDDELLELIAERDQQALGALYDRYDHLVFSIALRITGEQRGAEAVTEDVFLAVWEHAASLRSRTGIVSCWIAGMARSRAAGEMHVSSDTSDEQHIWREDRLGVMQWTGDGRDQQADAPDDVRLALAALPADLRQAVEFAVCSGMLTSEMAIALGTPEGVVKRQLDLGLGMLRDTLVRDVKTGQQIGASGPTTRDQG